MRKFLIIIERTETGFSAYVPDLPGCIATGDTKELLENNIYEAIQFHLEGLKEEGLNIPEAKSEAEVLLIAV
jgi:predicted RNase H-like HicB family nuclease